MFQFSSFQDSFYANRKKWLLIAGCIVAVIVIAIAIVLSFQMGKSAASRQKFDYDLSSLSTEDGYNQIVEMNQTPGECLYKTIKIKGMYYNSYSSATDSYYDYIVLTNDSETPVGFEFKYGDIDFSYLENGTVIEMSGMFSAYEEGGIDYCYLAADTMTVLDGTESYDPIEREDSDASGDAQ
jgi:hypothetical protein